MVIEWNDEDGDCSFRRDKCKLFMKLHFKSLTLKFYALKEHFSIQFTGRKHRNFEKIS